MRIKRLKNEQRRERSKASQKKERPMSSKMGLIDGIKTLEVYIQRQSEMSLNDMRNYTE